MKINNVNFRAKFLNKEIITKYNTNNNKYEPHEVSFVELDSQNPTDFKALVGIKNSYKQQVYLTNMLLDFYEKKNDAEKSKNCFFYALTSQNDLFNNIDKNKILGVIQVTKENEGIGHVEYIESILDNTGCYPNNKYKLIGSKMLEAIKKIYNEKISLYSPPELYHFYTKNEFKKGNEKILSLFSFIWKKKPN